MKKLVLLLGVTTLLWSCTNVKESRDYRELKAENDSLISLSTGQSNELFNYLDEFNEIQENLNEIKRRENIIDLNKQGVNESSKQKITEDIQIIYDLLKENREKLASLNKKYNNGLSQNTKLQKLMKSLEEQIKLKDAEILSLSQELQNLNIKIADLSSELQSTRSKNQEQAKIIKDLNSAYYAIGTRKELKEHKIITRKGGFLGIGKNTKLDESFDLSYFTKVSNKDAINIPIFAKKAKLITTHPKESYELERKDNKVDKLIVKDPKAFWSISKFLVIETGK